MLDANYYNRPVKVFSLRVMPDGALYPAFEATIVAYLGTVPAASESDIYNHLHQNAASGQVLLIETFALTFFYGCFILSQFHYLTFMIVYF